MRARVRVLGDGALVSIDQIDALPVDALGEVDTVRRQYVGLFAPGAAKIPIFTMGAVSDRKSLPMNQQSLKWFPGAEIREVAQQFAHRLIFALHVDDGGPATRRGPNQRAFVEVWVAENLLIEPQDGIHGLFTRVHGGVAEFGRGGKKMQTRGDWPKVAVG